MSVGNDAVYLFFWERFWKAVDTTDIETDERKKITCLLDVRIFGDNVYILEIKGNRKINISERRFFRRKFFEREDQNIILFENFPGKQRRIYTDQHLYSIFLIFLLFDTIYTECHHKNTR